MASVQKVGRSRWLCVVCWHGESESHRITNARPLKYRLGNEQSHNNAEAMSTCVTLFNDLQLGATCQQSSQKNFSRSRRC
jgi:hypothetical protein